MSKTTKAKPRAAKADTIGVRPCGCRACDLAYVDLFDVRGDLLASACLTRAQALDIAGALVDLSEQIASQAQRKTVQ
jgi:hypothetical protein